MTTATNTSTTPVAPQQPIESPRPAPQPEVVPLDRTLETIRADSLKDPEQYLDETEVPDGGE